MATSAGNHINTHPTQAGGRLCRLVRARAPGRRQQRATHATPPARQVCHAVPVGGSPSVWLASPLRWRASSSEHLRYVAWPAQHRCGRSLRDCRRRRAQGGQRTHFSPARCMTAAAVPERGRADARQVGRPGVCLHADDAGCARRARAAQRGLDDGSARAFSLPVAPWSSTSARAAQAAQRLPSIRCTSEPSPPHATSLLAPARFAR